MSPTPVAAPAAAAVSITSNSLFRRLLFLLGALMLAWPAVALEKVSVQLKWKHQFQFAGLYAAIEKGYFREAGFEVTWQTRDLHADEPAWNIRTEHEQMFTQMGIPTKALIARKAALPADVPAPRVPHGATE